MAVVRVIVIIICACTFLLAMSYAVVWWMKAMIVVWRRLKEEVRELLVWIER